MNYIPIALFWLLAAMAFFSPRPKGLLYLFFATMPFGSFAVVPPALTAGLTFTATPMVALLIIARVFMDARGLEYLLRMALAPRGLLLLFLFWAISAVITLFMPRVFAGEIEIIPMRLAVFMRSEMLQPTKQNISQLAYLTISVLSVPAIARLMSSPQMRQHALYALCLGGAITIATGLIDFASQYIPIQPLLAPFRTATYALLTEVSIYAGNKRVVGLMPEASTYGALCISFLTAIYFFRRSLLNENLRRKFVPVLLAGLALFTWLSTSSAAYVALIILAGVMGLEWLWRASLSRRSGLKRDLGLEFLVAFGGFVGVCAVLLFNPALIDPIIGLFNHMVLEKTTTSSFEERSFWTATSWQALLDTNGLGVGLGGTRASNSLVAILSNTGFAGGLCYYAFVLQTLLRRARPDDTTGVAMLNAVRWSIIPVFTSALLVGTTADFGYFNAWLYAMALAVAISPFSNTDPSARTRARHVPRHVL